MKNPKDWMRACLPDKPDKKRLSIYIDKDPQRYDSDARWREALYGEQ